MPEQRKRKLVDHGTRPTPEVVVRTHWVAVRFERFDPWHIIPRACPKFPQEAYALPDYDPTFGLRNSDD